MSKPKRPTPIVETIFPGQRLHLIGGASGAGKTTWMMQFLESWRRGEPIYGNKSNPSEFIFLSYDRAEDDFEETCERMKIDPATYNFVAPKKSDFRMEFLNMLGKLSKANPAARLLVVEGLSVKTPMGKINDPCVVGPWLREIGDACKEYELTILGSLHTAKTKEKDGYRAPRAKLSGCAAWAGFASTVIVLEEQGADTENSRRTLFILPRNAPKQVKTLDFKDGRMYEIVKTRSVRERIIAWLETGAPDEFSAQLCSLAIDAAPASIYTELPIIEKTGLIRKVSHGVYARTAPTLVN